MLAETCLSLISVFTNEEQCRELTRVRRRKCFITCTPSFDRVPDATQDQNKQTLQRLVHICGKVQRIQMLTSFQFLIVIMLSVRFLLQAFFCGPGNNLGEPIPMEKV